MKYEQIKHKIKTLWTKSKLNKNSLDKVQNEIKKIFFTNNSSKQFDIIAETSVTRYTGITGSIGDFDLDTFDDG